MLIVILFVLPRGIVPSLARTGFASRRKRIETAAPVAFASATPEHA